MGSTWKMLQMVAILGLIVAVKSEISQVIRKGCREKCGNVIIPYPFGLNKDCSLNQNFTLVCEVRNSTEEKPFLPYNPGSYEIIDISLDGTLRKYTYVAQECYTSTGVLSNHSKSDSTLSGFYYSVTRNKLTAVGCDTYIRYVGSTRNEKYGSGCISICYNKSSVTNGACDGIGCCQATIPKQLFRFRTVLGSYNNHTEVWDFNPCSYAFIADIDYFNFTIDSLETIPERVPTVVDWSVGDQSCTQAQKDRSSYACKDPYSDCQDSINGPGYLCLCKSGYTGNPYIPGGCLDVDECKASPNNCIHHDKCHNTNGSYTCSCQKWFHGDGRRDGVGCTLDKKAVLRGIFYILIGNQLSMVVSE